MRRMNSIQKDVFSAVAWRSVRTPKELSQYLPYSEHSIRRTINDLVQDGLIWKTVMVNPYTLGLTRFNMYFSFSSWPSGDTTATLKAIEEHPHVSWLTEVEGGEYSYELAFQCSAMGDFTDFIDSLSSSNLCSFYQKEVVAETSQSYFGVKYLSESGYRAPAVTWQSKVKPVTLDNLDVRIIHAACTSKAIQDSTIARSLGIPASSLQFRMNRLIKDKVIVADFYDTDWKMLGIERLGVLLYARHTSEKFRNELFAFCQEHPNIMYLHRCIGGWDFKVGIFADNMGMARGVLEELRAKFVENIGALRTVVQIRTFKDQFFPFTTLP